MAGVPLTDKIIPFGDSFTGLVNADQVIGNGGTVDQPPGGYLPIDCYGDIGLGPNIEALIKFDGTDLLIGLTNPSYHNLTQKVKITEDLLVDGDLQIGHTSTDESLTNFLVIDGDGIVKIRTSGADGSNGTSGSSGSSGTSGSSGSSGTSGSSGSSGTSGNSLWTRTGTTLTPSVSPDDAVTTTGLLTANKIYTNYIWDTTKNERSGFDFAPGNINAYVGDAFGQWKAYQIEKNFGNGMITFNVDGVEGFDFIINSDTISDIFEVNSGLNKIFIRGPLESTGDVTVAGKIYTGTASLEITDNGMFYTDADGIEHEVVFKDDICSTS